jgi:hypothetical protein
LFFFIVALPNYAALYHSGFAALFVGLIVSCRAHYCSGDTITTTTLLCRWGNLTSVISHWAYWPSSY